VNRFRIHTQLPRRARLAIVVTVCLGLLPTISNAQRRGPFPGGGGGAATPAGGGQTPFVAPRTVTLKAYKDVITDQAKSDPGLFTVHRIGDRILYEIPANMLGWEITCTN